MRATTKKGRQLFWKKKCTPRKKILATPMAKVIASALMLAVTLDTVNGFRIYTVNSRTASRRLVLVVVLQKMVEDF